MRMVCVELVINFVDLFIFGNFDGLMKFEREKKCNKGKNVMDLPDYSFEYLSKFTSFSVSPIRLKKNKLNT